MRGHRQPAVRAEATAAQAEFHLLSRHRRSKLARIAQTTLVKADQWGRGVQVPAQVAEALTGALVALRAKGAAKAKG